MHKKIVDGRVKPGHDELFCWSPAFAGMTKSPPPARLREGADGHLSREGRGDARDGPAADSMMDEQNSPLHCDPIDAQSFLVLLKNV
jgi:hypothetical protein